MNRSLACGTTFKFRSEAAGVEMDWAEWACQSGVSLEAQPEDCATLLTFARVGRSPAAQLLDQLVRILVDEG